MGHSLGFSFNFIFIYLWLGQIYLVYFIDISCDHTLCEAVRTVVEYVHAQAFEMNGSMDCRFVGNTFVILNHEISIVPFVIQSKKSFFIFGKSSRKTTVYASFFDFGQFIGFIFTHLFVSAIQLFKYITYLQHCSERIYTKSIHN